MIQREQIGVSAEEKKIRIFRKMGSKEPEARNVEII